MRFAILQTFAVNFACSSIQVPDRPFCRALNTKPQTQDVKGIGRVTLQRPNPVCMKEIGEAYCGYCTWSVSDKEVYVGNEWNHLIELKGKKKSWDTVRRQAVLTPAETMADLKAFAMNLCKTTGQCDQTIDRWRVKVDALDSTIDAFKGE